MCLAIPGEVVSLEKDGVAEVDVNGARQQVRLDTIEDEVEVGDYLLVHTGFAIRRLPEDEAEETLDLFDEYIEANKELESESEI